jgi:hypothetical protein
MIIFNDRKFNLNYFIKIYILTASILAITSLLQHFLPFGTFSMADSSLIRFSHTGIYIGIGGIYNTMGEFGFEGIIRRNQSWFSEPTNFGQFLMVPMFLSFYILTIKKSWINLLSFLSISIAFLSTYSVANFFGLIGGLIFLYFSKMRNRGLEKKLFNSKIFNLIIVLLLVFSLVLFFNYTNQESDLNVLTKSTMRGLKYKLNRNIIFFDKILEHPFGDINYKHEFTRSTGMIGNIAITGGYPLLVFFLFFYVYFFTVIYKQMIKSQYLAIYAGIFAYFIPCLWDAKFYEDYFLFTFIFYSTFLKHDQMGHEII